MQAFSWPFSWALQRMPLQAGSPSTYDLWGNGRYSDKTKLECP